MYKTKYIIPFENNLNQPYEIFLNYRDYTGSFTTLIAGDPPCNIQSTNGDQDPLYPLLGSELTMTIPVGVTVNNVVQNANLTIRDFVATNDKDIQVQIFYNKDYSKTVWEGYVDVEANSQPFYDPPFVLSIRATDGLGLLKGVDFTDADGNLFAGSLTPLDWIANILYKAGSQKNIRCYFPFTNTVASSTSPITAFTIAAITFYQSQPQTTIDPSVDVLSLEADDCNSALEKIVRCLGCRLYQENGVWVLKSLASYIFPNGNSYQEFTVGDPVDGYVVTTQVASAIVDLDISIGDKEIMRMVTGDGTLSPKRGTKWVKLTYNFDQSLNKICNQDLAQGLADPSNNGTISSTFIDAGITPAFVYSYLAYQAFCFEHLDGPGEFHPYPSISPTAAAYIRDIQDVNGNSVDRMLVLAKPTSILTYLRSTKFLIDKGDVLNLSFDWRTKENVNSPAADQTADVAYIFLYGIDGTFWAFGYSPQGTNKPQWVQMPDANFVDGAGNTPNLTTPEFGDSANNGYLNCSTVLQTSSGFYYGAAPVSGDIEILFLNIPGQLPSVTEYWFKNIKVAIVPFINGSFRPLNGDFNFMSSNSTINQTDSDTREISDAYRRYLKGALLQSDGKSLMTITWKGLPTDPPTRFTKLMDKLRWNILNPVREKIEGQVRGLTYVDSTTFEVFHSGFSNSYFFTDGSNITDPTRKFILTSFDSDFGTGQSRMVFIEVQHDVNDTVWNDPDTYVYQTF